ncbi:cell wall integrity and stress response component 4-like [Haliotis rubra]|uniref:cell wall integrity and stress response component 4-like n=1 Tax=Haliotis rubra TaxID=36100 RepID=UPI001EE531AF|nr:cell wall integrity and stress response component 4-like [Haliotis rubra]
MALSDMDLSEYYEYTITPSEVFYDPSDGLSMYTADLSEFYNLDPSSAILESEFPSESDYAGTSDPAVVATETQNSVTSSQLSTDESSTSSQTTLTSRTTPPSTSNSPEGTTTTPPPSTSSTTAKPTSAKANNSDKTSSASSLLLAQGVSGACEDTVNVCGNTMFAEIDAASGDNPAICAAVDKALECVATETASCALMEKADIIAAMDDIIGVYKAAPYNCTLPNSNNAAFNDPCGDALSYCLNIYYEAQFTPTTTGSCQEFDRYLLCLQANTTACDATAQTLITQTKSDTVTTMNADPLLLLGDEITVFTNCVTTNNAKCSPRLQQQYSGNAVNLTVTFQGDPYYCGAANPCLEAFKGCNASENLRLPAAGCSLLEVYDACFTTVSPICDSDKLTETTTEVNTLKQQLTSDFGCE